MQDFEKILKENASAKGAKSDIKIQYNKNDITAIFRKSFCEKMGVENCENLHFENVEKLQNAIEKIEKLKNVKITIA